MSKIPKWRAENDVFLFHTVEKSKRLEDERNIRPFQRNCAKEDIEI